MNPDIPKDTIKELALHDPQMSAAMMSYADGTLTWTEMLERLVIVLVNTKFTLNKELTRVMAHASVLYCPCNCHQSHRVDVRYCTICISHNHRTGKPYGEHGLERRYVGVNLTTGERVAKDLPTHSTGPSQKIPQPPALDEDGYGFYQTKGELTDAV